MNRVALAALAIALGSTMPVVGQDTAEPVSAEPVTICYYAGLEYSQWAQLPNGQICQPGGLWNYPEKSSEAPSAEPAPAG